MAQQLAELSLNNMFSATPKYSTTPSSDQRDKSITSYNLSMYEPWAKPMVLKLNLKHNPSKTLTKNQNLVKQRKFVSTLKYRKIFGDKFRRDPSTTTPQHKDHQLLNNTHYRTLVKFSNKSALELTAFGTIESMKKTLKQTCQSRPIKLQNRPMSSKRINTQPNQRNNSTAKIRELLHKMRGEKPRSRKRSETFDCLCGW